MSQLHKAVSFVARKYWQHLLDSYRNEFGKAVDFPSDDAQFLFDMALCNHVIRACDVCNDEQAKLISEFVGHYSPYNYNTIVLSCAFLHMLESDEQACILDCVDILAYVNNNNLSAAEYQKQLVSLI